MPRSSHETRSPIYASSNSDAAMMSHLIAAQEARAYEAASRPTTASSSSIMSRLSSGRLLAPPDQPPKRPALLKPKPSFKRLFKRGAGMPCPPPIWQHDPSPPPVPTRSKSSNALPSWGAKPSKGEGGEDVSSMRSATPEASGTGERNRRKRSSTIVSFTSLLSFGSNSSPLIRSLAAFGSSDLSTVSLPSTPDLDGGSGGADLSKQATIKARRSRQRSSPIELTLSPPMSVTSIVLLTDSFPCPPSRASSLTPDSSPESLASDFLPRSMSMYSIDDACESASTLLSYCMDADGVPDVDDRATAHFRTGSIESLCDPTLMSPRFEMSMEEAQEAAAPT